MKIINQITVFFIFYNALQMLIHHSNLEEVERLSLMAKCYVLPELEML